MQKIVEKGRKGGGGYDISHFTLARLSAGSKNGVSYCLMNAKVQSEQNVRFHFPFCVNIPFHPTIKQSSVHAYVIL